MIPGESNGTERTVSPFSSVVCRIGNGKTLSAARLVAGAAAASPINARINLPAKHLIITRSANILGQSFVGCETHQSRLPGERPDQRDENVLSGPSLPICTV